MKCKRVRELLPLYADGDLEGPPREAVAEHLEECETCRRRLPLDRELAAMLAGRPAPADAARVAPLVRVRVLADIERKRRWQPFWRAAERFGNVTVWAMMSAVTVLLLLGLATTWRSLNQRPAEGAPYGPPATGVRRPVVQAELKERVNILLLGVDRRDGDAGPWRTDSMIVFSVDPVSNTASVLSIPRDLWVTLPGYDIDERISAAYAYGDQLEYPGGGPELAKRTVQYNLGIPIHYYARIDFPGFVKIVDSIGGIEVDVPRDIVDNAYPTADYGTMQVRIPAGRQTMDGDLALKYARIRHDSSDIDRMARQQQVIMAVRDKVLSLDFPATRIPEQLRLLADSLQTDMSLEVLYAIARAARQVPSENIQSGVIDESMVTSWQTPQGWTVLVPQPEKVRELVGRLFPAAPGSQPVAVPQYGQPVDLVEVPPSVGGCRLSPDGRWLAYSLPQEAGVESGAQSALVARNLETGEITTVLKNVPAEMSVSWLPDSRRLAVVAGAGGGQSGAVLLAALGDWPVRTLAAPEGDIQGFGEVAASPDGSRVAYTVFHDASPAPVPSIGIEVFEFDGEVRRQVVTPGYFIGHLAWTPDGRQIVYFKGKGGTPPDDGESYVANADGTGEPRLVIARARLAAWSPDGRQALWLGEPADEQGRGDLVLGPWPSVGPPAVLAEGVDASGAAWAGDCCVVYAQDGALYLLATGSDAPPQPRRLTLEAEWAGAPVWVAGKGLFYQATREGAAGSTLRLLPVAGSKVPQVTLTSIDMVDASAGWALSEQAVLRTIDGGRTWLPVEP